MSDIKDWWIKVDVLNWRKIDVPRFRVGRKKMGGRWENRWHIDIRVPSIWGRLSETQKKEHLENETLATSIWGNEKSQC